MTPRGMLLILVATTIILPAHSSATLGGSLAVLGILAAVGWWRFNPPPDVLFTPEPNSLQGKTILITGGSTGLGLESAKRLAVGDARIIVTARSNAKGQAAVQTVRDYLEKIDPSLLSEARIDYKLLDLDDLQSVQDAAESWQDIERVDVLINNAGFVGAPQRELTKDGVERHIQSNHLGHFVLTAKLAPKLATNARIINVSSNAYRLAIPNGLDFDYIWKAETGYGRWKSYGQSKLANILFTQELQRRADSAGLDWAVSSLHPGAVGTDLDRHLLGFPKDHQQEAGFFPKLLRKVARLILLTVEQGATTQVFLAAGANEELPQGGHFVNCRRRELHSCAKDQTAAKRLWKESEEISGVRFELKRTPVAMID